MLMKNQQGQIVIGVLVAILFLGLPIFLVVGSGIAFYRSSKLQAQLIHPEVHFLHKETIDNTDFEINVSVPSKAILGSTTGVYVWITAQSNVTTTQNFTVSTYVTPPMFVTGTTAISVTSRSDEYLTYESIGKFDYGVLDLDTKERNVELTLKIEADILSEPETVILTIPVDSDIVHRRIVVERRWQIIGMVIGTLIQLVFGFLFGNS